MSRRRVKTEDADKRLPQPTIPYSDAVAREQEEENAVRLNGGGTEKRFAQGAEEDGEEDSRSARNVGEEDDASPVAPPSVEAGLEKLAVQRGDLMAKPEIPAMPSAAAPGMDFADTLNIDTGIQLENAHGAVVDGESKDAVTEQDQQNHDNIEVLRSRLTEAQRQAKEANDAYEAAVSARQENPYTESVSQGQADYLNTLAEYMSAAKPLDVAEQQRRARAAHAVAGIGALGNALGALGNVFGTAYGAENQKPATLPDVQKVVNDERAYQQQLAQRYMDGSAKGLAAIRAQKEAWDAERGKELSYLAQLAKLRNDAVTSTSRSLYDAERLVDADTKIANSYNLGNRRVTVQENRAQHQNAKDDSATNKNNASAANGGGSGGSKFETISSNYGGGIRVDKASINENNLQQIVEMIPGGSKFLAQTVHDTYSESDKLTYRDRRKTEMWAFIGKHMNLRRVDAAVRNLAAGRGVSDQRGFDEQKQEKGGGQSGTSQQREKPKDVSKQMQRTKK